MKPITVVYKPSVNKQKFCPETGKPTEPIITHFLETAEGRHLGVLSNPYCDDSPDPVAVAQLFEAARELLETLKAFPGFTDDATIGDAWVERKNAAIAKAQGQ